MPEPPEHLPESVYVRRRAIALGGAVLALVLLIWLIGAAMSTSSPESQNTASSSGLIESPSSVPPSTMPDSPSSSMDPSTTAPPTTSAAASGSAAPSGGASVSSSVSSAAASRSAGPCADAALAVAATVDKPSYKIGQQPVLGIVLTNIGKTSCTKDVNRKLRELVVSSASGARVWSSADCYLAKTPPEVHTLAPGQQLSYTLDWAGRTSAVGCPSQRNAVPAGRYTVTAKLGNLAGKPVSFTLTK